MTPEAIMNTALANVGLGTTAGIRNQARTYLNQTAQAIYAWAAPTSRGQRHAVRWTWALKSTTLTMVADQRAYTLAVDVLDNQAFYDTTNNEWIPMDTVSTIDGWDPDQSETGDAMRVVLTGRDTSTGAWTVEVYPTPTATDSLRYRYYARWVDRVVGDDATDLAPLMPEWIQPALTHGVEMLYYRHKGDMDAARDAQLLRDAIVNGAVSRNATSQGRSRIRLMRPRRGRTIIVRDGSLAG